MDEDDNSYTNVHRALAQAFFSNSSMTVEETKPVLAAIMTAHVPNRPTLPGDITNPLIASTIQMVNTRLLPLDYEIRSMRDQTTKTLTYALVNTTSDLVTQLATTFSIEELAYIKRILDYMFETKNSGAKEVMAITALEAGQLARAPRRARQSQAASQANRSSMAAVADDDDDENTNMQTQTEAQIKGIDISHTEVVLSQLVDQSFLHKTRFRNADYYTLAPRGLMELRTYLKETYNEPADPEDPDDEPIVRIRDCDGCKEIVTVGVRCPKSTCPVRWHDACANQYFRRGAGECPKCKTEWEEGYFVGIRAVEGAGVGRQSTATNGRRQSTVTNGGRQSTGRRQSTTTNSRVSRGRQQVEEEEEEEEDGEEVEDMDENED